MLDQVLTSPSQELCVISPAKIEAQLEEERRQLIEKEKSARQAAQAKEAESERAAAEAAAIAAVSRTKFPCQNV